MKKPTAKNTRIERNRVECHCFSYLNDNRNGPHLVPVEHLHSSSNSSIMITDYTCHSLCKSSNPFVMPQCKVNPLSIAMDDIILHHEENFLMSNGYRVYSQYTSGEGSATDVERCRKHVAQRLEEIRSQGNCNPIIHVMREFLEYTSGSMCNRSAGGSQ